MKKIYVVYRFRLDDANCTKQFECAFSLLANAIDFVQRMNEAWQPCNIVYDYYPLPFYDTDNRMFD